MNLNKYLVELKDGRKFVVSVVSHCSFTVMNERIKEQLLADGFTKKEIKGFTWEMDE
jgi:hypothetical protein